MCVCQVKGNKPRSVNPLSEFSVYFVNRVTQAEILFIINKLA